ncbi:MAG: phosphoribosylglycinamide formyltransferase [Candidatus Marinimicrobia bacterium]|nr:phosphoribosylglycinamide formyltransferase [Candidatus Neomarinimicrobiota bacterium]
MKRLALFVSGDGSNFRAIHQAVLDGVIDGVVGLVVTDKIECPAAAYAREHAIELYPYPVAGQTPASLVKALNDGAIDFLILAGYLKMVPVEVVRAYPRKILNIHPALLPDFGGPGFYGRRVHEAVLASGAEMSGATVHFVDAQYDHGPTVAQVTVPVEPEDTPATLAARVLEQEHRLYSQVVAALCRGAIDWEDGTPHLEPPLTLPNLYKTRDPL